jgi:hypothetical protein
VQKHLEHVYRKLGVADRLSAVRVAVELGIIDTDRLQVSMRELTGADALRVPRRTRDENQ